MDDGFVGFFKFIATTFVIVVILCVITFFFSSQSTDLINKEKVGFVKITEDNSETLSVSKLHYYYLSDTDIVYILSNKTYMPLISANGYYYRYDVDTNSVKEIK
jgi:hypothetical protein